MIKSMTGYGRARQVKNNRDITVEIRSVNNRYLDTTVKLPRAYIFTEDAIKQRVQKAVSRGKIDVFVTIDATAADETTVTVNEPLAKAYIDAIARIGELEFGKMSGMLAKGVYSAADIARFPDVLSVTKADEDLESVQDDICAIVDEACAAYNSMRATEGEKLASDISSRLDTIEALTAKVEERSPETVREYREKLTARMCEVLQSTTIDEARILTEAAIYADKVAVDEETVRLRSHVSQLRGMLASDEPMGRKMDFLIQEVNRESNTIGSKCNDVEIARVVVDLKAEVEKIREQVQNIE
ncbi:MAG: YicC family protein [Oscillospiraceae bacterium]|nr:YicC family protein [Oscillospiraceae bacterium]